jgi:uncharacterized protein YktB (UPF0637 family)
MNKYLLIFWAILLFSVTMSEAQRRRLPGPERIERFKKMELLEVLKLDEEKAVRFSVRFDTHEDKMKQLREARNIVLDELDSLVQKNSDPKKYQKLVDKVYENDQNMFTERKRFLDEMRALLTAEQFAKFLVFEKKFEQRLRDAMREMRRGRFERQPE